MITQSAAILRLLDDDEPGTVALMKSKLEEIAPLSALRSLRQLADGRAGQHLDDLIADLSRRTADADFTACCVHFAEQSDLENASWLFASTFYPGEDFAPQRQHLDDWGARLTPVLEAALTPEEKVAALTRFLGTEIGLRGNDSDYYNLENSILPRVVETRRGIPISLALVYILVARRAGLRVDGIGIPGHFLARHENVFFDPFHRGQRVGMEECAAMLEQQNLVLTPEHLLPTSARQMLIRMLMNVFYVSQQAEPALAEKVNGWIDLLRRPTL